MREEPAASEDPFRVDHLTVDLARRTVRGGAATLLCEVATMGVAVASTMVLARLLTPTDFGLVAMALVFLAVARVLGELGLPAATVQAARIDQAQATSLFWLGVLLAAGVTLAMAAATPAIAWLYGEPVLHRVVPALACVVVLRSVGVQHQALLRRQMRFGALALGDLVAIGAGFAAAGVLAARGAGYWALVAQQLVAAAVASAGAWWLSGWRPGAPVLLPEVRPLVAFGANLAGAGILESGARSVDRLLIGSVWGSTPLGLYATAHRLQLRLLHLPLVPISRIAPPTLGRLRAEPDRFRSYYRTGLLYSLAVSAPLAVFLVVAADRLIEVLLGPQWLAAAPIFRVLAVGALASAFDPATAWLYVALGRTDRLLRWTVVEALALGAGAAIGVRWGALGVAVASAGVLWALRVPSALYCFRDTPVDLHEVVRATWRPVLAAVLAGLAFTGVGALRAPGTSVVRELGLDVAVYALFYASIWLVLPQGWQTAGQTLRIIRTLGRSDGERATRS